MSRNGNNVTLRKDGRWEARYIKKYNEGKAVYGYIYAKTKDEALRLKSIKASELSSDHSRIIFFKDLVNLYIVQKKHQVKETTYSHYNCIIRSHILPDLGNICIEDINSFLIEEYVLRKIECGNLLTGEGLSTKSVRDIMTLLKSIIRYGCEKGINMDETIFSIKAPRVVNKEIEILSESERIMLEKCAFQANDMTFGIYLALYTGLRIGELCALKWSDIDTDDDCIYIDNTITRISNFSDNKSKTQIVISSPKTQASKRIIPLPSKLKKSLLQRKPLYNDVFFLTGTDKYIEPRNYYKKYQTFLAECGICPHTFHALRHTFATRCIELGFDAKVLSEILGHANVKITLDRYVHPSMDRKRKCMQLL